MANHIKYENQVWGAPISGQRLSTNGHYTGQRKGTPTQAEGETLKGYEVETDTIRLGTITQDAVPGSTPTVQVEP